jgi:hypothetical protein
MIRVLSMIALAGFLLSVACLSAAIALGGPELITSAAWGWTRHGMDVHWTHTGPYTGPRITREVPWKGGETLVVQIPADVTFTQADGPPRLVVRGPKDALQGLMLDQSMIAPRDIVQGRDTRQIYEDAAITIELTAPKVTTFQTYDSGKLQIRNYHQDRLRIGSFGSRDITADGVARRLDLRINGSDHADLSRLSVEDSAVDLQGSGEATLAPKTWAQVDVSGSSDVTLTHKPKQLQTNVTGSGRITMPGAVSDSSGADSGEPT